MENGGRRKPKTIQHTFTDKYFRRFWIATSKNSKIKSSWLVCWVKHVLVAVDGVENHALFCNSNHWQQNPELCNILHFCFVEKWGISAFSLPKSYRLVKIFENMLWEKWTCWLLWVCLWLNSSSISQAAGLAAAVWVSSITACWLIPCPMTQSDGKVREEVLWEVFCQLQVDPVYAIEGHGSSILQLVRSRIQSRISSWHPTQQMQFDLIQTT